MYVCSNFTCTSTGAGPHISTFSLASSRPKLWLTFYTAVWPTAVHTGASSFPNQKSGFEVKTLCVALEGVERLLLEVELVARLQNSGQKLM